MECSHPLVLRFLDNACPDHHVRGASDHLAARHTAMRLLEACPEIGQANFRTAIVTGDVAAVERALAEDPDLATRGESPAGPSRSGVGGWGDLVKRDWGAKGWEPLLYLCFTRLPLAASNDNALAMARMLLDRGANPNAYFMAGDSRYTPLVGAIGEGEENRPPHPHRDALVDLLLERGAEPYDQQVVYNIHFHARVLWFLKVIHARALALGRGADWADPDWTMLDMGGYGNGARWFLNIAIEHHDVELAEWCLAHGAGPNAAPAKGRARSKRSLYEEAVHRGRLDIADRLIKHGAHATICEPDPVALFAADCLTLSRERMAAAIAEHPEFLQAHEPLFTAADRDREEVVGMLIDLGVSPNIENASKERALHIAAYANSLRTAALLLARGADIDPVGEAHDNTPIGAALYTGHQAMFDLLAPHSRDLWELTFGGAVDRVRELLDEHPAAAKALAGPETRLMWLPRDDEDRALALAEMLLERGADPDARNANGKSAADIAEHLAMFRLADRLRRAAAEWTTSH